VVGGDNAVRHVHLFHFHCPCASAEYLVEVWASSLAQEWVQSWSFYPEMARAFRVVEVVDLVPSQADEKDYPQKFHPSFDQHVAVLHSSPIFWQ